MNKWTRRISIALAVTVVAYPALWLGVQQSDAFAAARSFVKADARVAHALGPVREVSLAPFADFSVEVTGASGNASFELTVAGATGKAKAFVELHKLGDWTIRSARLIAPSGAVTTLDKS